MEQKGSETRKNPIVFKNALADAWNLLSDDQQNHKQIGAVLERLKHLDNVSDPFWQNQLSGLAIVISEVGTVTAYRVPFPLKCEAHVSDRPYLAPLLRLCDPLHFYVLALDFNETRLYAATRWNTTELVLDNTPSSLDEANKFDDPEKSLQSHSVSGSNQPGAGSGDAAFHGHGASGDENRRKAITHFYETINRSLPLDLPDRKTPLVLFTDVGEAGHFRATYQATPLHICGITQNTTGLSRDETHDLITSWVAEREDERLSEALEALGAASANDSTTTGLEAIINAAQEGRVATLFVKSGARRWGVVNGKEAGLTIHDKRRAGDSDLIGLACLHTAETSGKIVVIPEGKEHFEDVPVAAILRY